MDADLWTLDQLTERVEAALALDYRGQLSGRVRAVPDRRAIRWYTTIGLVDRPAEMRGRTALYGRRHLLQLVAIKRRQAQGQALARIQAELSGATDETLESIAALTADPDPAAVPTRRFWTDRPAARPDAPAASPVTAVRLADGVTVVLDRAGVQATQLTAADLAALRAAATPLLAELAGRRLAPEPPAQQSGDPT
jgi:DNA-binding transcriptional MerR regulator